MDDGDPDHDRDPVPAVLTPAARRSCFIDRAAAKRALQMALPMIEPLMQDPRVSGAGFLSIVILDPGLDEMAATFEQAVLLEHAVGDRSRWDADYTAFAMDKARLSWRHRCDGSRLLNDAPHRLAAGESLLAGSVWLDGIIVSVSGAHPWFDEAIALAIAGCMRAIAKERHAQARESRATHARP